MPSSLNRERENNAHDKCGKPENSAPAESRKKLWAPPAMDQLALRKRGTHLVYEFAIGSADPAAGGLCRGPRSYRADSTRTAWKGRADRRKEAVGNADASRLSGLMAAVSVSETLRLAVRPHEDCAKLLIHGTAAPDRSKTMFAHGSFEDEQFSTASRPWYC